MFDQEEVIFSWFIMIQLIYKIIKRKKHVSLCTKILKSDVDGIKHINETIEYINEKIQYGITSMNGEELESNNITRTFDNEANKHKETLSTYDNEGEENNYSMSKKKEKERDGNIIIQ